MKYKHLFFDLDHTLWDFDANCRFTLETIYQNEALESRGIHSFEEFFKQYNIHNDRLWERYRSGQIKADELRWKRMFLSLLDFRIGDEKLARELSNQFLDMLPSRTILFPYCMEILSYLKGKGYVLHLITNGFEKTQYSKITYSGIDHFFAEVITSEGSNSLKPHKEIFDYAFQRAKALPEHSIMIGDSIEADIKGAINAGIDQVFMNHLNIQTDVKPTYTAYSLKELEDIF
ncbi:YjjG family noncanonical pyrimidine nucleotidase [Pseudoflavitalea rhizosphaerae]|uniref:YjjG family noncanonical pyrimidine nucleotidase n=1 Tax=Pseudoflavitalea rhizosphaerae TaxID=1884793 RepID=UPI000F8F1BF6|nr:YjjG family noncanonical pyrimidine nucleotidase [Pseudoflavitalea rhizosphaerae]